MPGQMCADGRVRGKREASLEAACLTPGCKFKFGGSQEKKGGRGLCHYCHNVASNLIKKGATTWEELEQLGLAQPPYRTLFEKAFKQRRKEVREEENLLQPVEEVKKELGES